MPSPYPDFAVRDRFDDARDLAWELDPAFMPLALPETEKAIADALDLWRATGVVGFHRRREGETAQFVIAFKHANHGTCRPFVNWDGEVAHTGPIDGRIEIHLDGDLEWSARGEKGYGAFQTILHEVGHALGLDHSLDPAALMHAKYGVEKTRLERSDLAGIHSLYGGGEDGDGDVIVAAMHEEMGMTAREMMGAPGVTCTLRGVAPNGVSDFMFADVDGDGRDEIVTWRTDALGHGAMKYYFFDAKGRVRRTIGPMIGQLGAGRRPFFVRYDEKRPLLIAALSDGRYSGFLLGDFGIPEGEWPRGKAFDPVEGEIADTDGDGRIDIMPKIATPPAGHSRDIRRGNLDGQPPIDEACRFVIRNR